VLDISDLFGFDRHYYCEGKDTSMIGWRIGAALISVSILIFDRAMGGGRRLPAAASGKRAAPREPF
jgi:hypothetical protein